MRDIGLHKTQLDSLDAAIIHVTWCHTVRARERIVDGGLCNALHGLHLVEGSVLVQDAAVAVRGVFAEADVGHDEHLREGLLDGFDGAYDGAIGVGGFGAGGVFGGGGEGDAEEDDGAEAFGDEGGEEGD